MQLLLCMKLNEISKCFGFFFITREEITCYHYSGKAILCLCYVPNVQELRFPRCCRFPRCRRFPRCSASLTLTFILISCLHQLNLQNLCHNFPYTCTSTLSHLRRLPHHLPHQYLKSHILRFCFHHISLSNTGLNFQNFLPSCLIQLKNLQSLQLQDRRRQQFHLKLQRLLHLPRVLLMPLHSCIPWSTYLLFQMNIFLTCFILIKASVKL